jgi:hypothetical protein
MRSEGINERETLSAGPKVKVRDAKKAENLPQASPFSASPPYHPGKIILTAQLTLQDQCIVHFDGECLCRFEGHSVMALKRKTSAEEVSPAKRRLQPLLDHDGNRRDQHAETRRLADNLQQTQSLRKCIPTPNTRAQKHLASSAMTLTILLRRQSPRPPLDIRRN